MQLVDPAKTYELSHPSGAVFIMNYWTMSMQEIVDKECVVKNDKNELDYLIARERDIKINLAVRDWKGVEFSGVAVECTSENKRLLPVGVLFWLVKDIDERAGFRMTDTEKKI